ncbi:hypothetical protein Q4S45_08335 [Massilia sp. R2A-15]|uniref:hypothetical protein n=1 Tax=Massilia sp. R2A-15 TaxID=3064278 RepID=UPI00273651BF|nr:hypothetical protein [Massilia sp. R2A-15]WLI91113.1 hypothetical protein Q4S45_08335 [Massilia sp. R2A-15]
MKNEPLKPPFRRVARCLTCLALLVGMLVIMLFAAMYLPSPINNILNPHSTGGGITLLVLFGLAVINFIALMYFVSIAAVDLYRQPAMRKASHCSIVILGVLGILLLGSWLNWFYHR